MTRGRYRKGFFVGKLYHIGSNDPSSSRRKVDYVLWSEVERDGRMLKSSWRMHLKIPIRSCIISILYE